MTLTIAMLSLGCHPAQAASASATMRSTTW
jgi:hypothetical protein